MHVSKRISHTPTSRVVFTERLRCSCYAVHGKLSNWVSNIFWIRRSSWVYHMTRQLISGHWVALLQRWWLGSQYFLVCACAIVQALYTMQYAAIVVHCSAPFTHFSARFQRCTAMWINVKILLCNRCTVIECRCSALHWCTEPEQSWKSVCERWEWSWSDGMYHRGYRKCSSINGRPV